MLVASDPVIRRLAISALVAISLGAPARAADARDEGSVAAGRELALQACSDCHVVAPGQKSTPLLTRPTPNFEEIAERPQTSAPTLRRFINNTHWDKQTHPIKMPNPWLTKVQTDDIIAYILSLHGSHRIVSAPPSTPMSRREAQRNICLDKCVGDVHSRCVLGYCVAREATLFLGLYSTSSVIKRCQAKC